jgi:hypothetical protein
MEPGDWKYVAVIVIMAGSLALVAYGVPRMTEAEDRFQVAALSGDGEGARAAEFDRLFWGSAGVLGSLAALLALLSLFFIGVRGPMGRGGMSRAQVREEEMRRGKEESPGRVGKGAGEKKAGEARDG